MNKNIVCAFLFFLVSGCGTQAVEPDEYAADAQKDIPWDYLSGKIAYSLTSFSGGDYHLLVFILDVAQRKVVYQYAIPTNSSFMNSTAISPPGDSIAFTANYNVSVFKISPNEVPLEKVKTYTANCIQSGVSWLGPGRLSSRGFSYEMQSNSLFINGELYSPLKGDLSSRAAWSPDGQTAVVCLHDEYSSGSLYLFTLKDSSLIPYFQPRPVDSVTFYDPALSPDGKSIVFGRTIKKGVADGSQLWGFSLCVMNVDGTGLRIVNESTDAYFEPAWSPDGKKIVYQRLGNIYVINPDGNYETKICAGVNPSWGK